MLIPDAQGKPAILVGRMGVSDGWLDLLRPRDAAK